MRHSYVDQCLVEDGLHFISMETTIKLLSLECGLCGDVKATSAELKNHLSYVHFSKELEREFPGDHPVHKNKRCDHETVQESEGAVGNPFCNLSW